MSFLKLTNKKTEFYNIILVIINWLTKIVYSKLVKIRIYTKSLTKVIFNIVLWHYSILNSNIST